MDVGHYNDELKVSPNRHETVVLRDAIGAAMVKAASTEATIQEADATLLMRILSETDPSGADGFTLIMAADNGEVLARCLDEAPPNQIDPQSIFATTMANDLRLEAKIMNINLSIPDQLPAAFDSENY